MKLPISMKIGGCSGIILIIGILFGFIAFPMLIKSGLKKNMSLKKGTDIRDMWSKVPFAIDFKIYLFNCTNPDEVMKGGKPKLQEVGPYYYEEWKEKVNMLDVEEEDALIYNRRDTFLFKPEKSGKGLTGNEIIVMPNIFMMALGITVAVEKPAMLNVIGKAFKGIFADPQTVFMQARAQDILFDGMVINCSQTDFAPKAVCTAIKKEATNLIFLPDNQFKFSLFGMRNGTIDPVRIKVIRGMKNVMEVGRITEVDGATEQSIWTGSCNKYDGTDGTIFPPFLTAKDRLESYSPDICRTFRPEFRMKTKYKGLATNRYYASVGDLNTDEELHCFCPTPETCPKRGLMDLTKCVKAPLFISLPHYYDTDPSVQNGVIGLHPDEEKHSIYLDFEPVTGTPLNAKQRLQFNIQLKKIEKLELFKDLPDTFIPLFWVEEGISLDDDFIKILDGQLFKPVRIVNVVKWIMFSFGLIGILAGVFLHFKDTIMAFAVNPEAPPANGQALKDLEGKKGPNASAPSGNDITTVQGSDDDK